MNPHRTAPASATPSGATSEPSVANRYGTPKRALGKRQRNVIIAAVLAVAVVAAGFFSFTDGSKVTSKDIAFDILSPTGATVTFDMERNAADRVECAVRVLDDSYAVVGWKSVVFEAGEGSGREKVRRTVELRTEALGTTGGIGGCWKLD
ncbi:DUF4307 domain-containing protein [Arthrobacter ginkgonis]|uniref:DUF4307 domain-containing protein n=1 Tax=Arthrobacter ginkgonis TaxID=1630594 RepID=UPI0031E96FC2